MCSLKICLKEKKEKKIIPINSPVASAEEGARSPVTKCQQQVSASGGEEEERESSKCLSTTTREVKPKRNGGVSGSGSCFKINFKKGKRSGEWVES